MSNVNLHEQKDLPFKTDINMLLIMQFKKKKKSLSFLGEKEQLLPKTRWLVMTD
jgi:hypothetical protein